MEITLIQGILIAILALIVGIDFWLEALFIFRPIIVSTLVGFILGDVKLGLICGGLLELIFSGLTPAGGVQPPNPILVAIMAPVLAYSSGVETKAAISLALPFSFLMQYVILFCYSSFSFFMKGADEAAENGDVNGIYKLNIKLTLIIGILYAVISFLSAYLAQDLMRQLVTSLPEWVTHAFGVVGGVLPAVGFAMLLKILLKVEYTPYLIIGFLLATFNSFTNVLPIALVGLAMAIISFSNTHNGNNDNNSSNQEEEEFADGI